MPSEADHDGNRPDRLLFDVPIDDLSRGSNCRANGQQRICLLSGGKAIARASHSLYESVMTGGFEGLA
jgi:hypothetical protein